MTGGQQPSTKTVVIRKPYSGPALVMASERVSQPIEGETCYYREISEDELHLEMILENIVIYFGPGTSVL